MIDSITCNRTNEMPEHRRFTRIVFSTPATIVALANDDMWTSQLVDLSLKGALVKKPPGWQQAPGEKFALSFQLLGTDIDIHMLVHKAHEHPDSIGFACDSIDIDSASHLRRLIELNVGSAELLDRDLAHLTVPED